MSNQLTITSMRDDNRAVSTVIGVVILFGFLILALSLYQVEVVPQQNAETEFQHSGEVRNDLVELRAGILQAGSIDQPQYQTVQLGTTYSTRVFSINPPAPAGTIRTSEPYPITIAYESNETVIKTIPTRFIEYQPGYNELDRSPTWYGASVLYLDARDEGGGIAVIEDQTLVDGSEVQITALQNEFRRSANGRVTLELRPADSVTGELPEGVLNVTVPTRLSGEEYWDQTDVSSITEDSNDDGIHNLTIETTADNLTVDTVGVQKAPEEATQNNNAQIGNGRSDDETGETVGKKFEVTLEQLNGNDIEIRFRNNNDFDVDVERIRLDSYTEANPPNGAKKEPIDRIEFQDGSSDPVLMEDGQFKSVNIQTFSNGDNQQYILTPRRIDNKKIPEATPESGDEFMITLEFGNGDTKQYTISLP